MIYVGTPPRLRIPAIRWGPNWERTLVFGYPPDEAVSWAEPRGMRQARAMGGLVAGWSYGDDWLLGFTARYIEPGGLVQPGAHVGPAAQTSGASSWPVTRWWQRDATGYQTGWAGFLAYAQAGHAFRWHADYTELLNTTATPGIEAVLHSVEEPGEEDDLTRSVAMVIRATVPFTGY